MKKYCYYNGRIIELKNLRISPYDLGFLRAYAAFDFMVTENGKPFMWRDHFRRLKRSARAMNIPVPIKEKEFEKITLKLLKKHTYKKSIIRMVLTGGISANGFLPSGVPTLLILIEKVWDLPRHYYTDGVPLITIDYQRSLPHVKNANYIEALRHDHLRRKAHALEVLYAHNGKIFECASSNFFIVKNNRIITPKDDILLGITRALVLKRAQQHYQIVERPIRERELQTADEAFLTASAKGIVPVTKIDRKRIGNGKPGPVTQHVMKLYKDYVENY